MSEQLQAKVVQIGKKEILDFDDIKCILNPTQSMDLEKILRLTSARNRIDVSLSFAGGLTRKDWFYKAGVIEFGKNLNYITRWLDKECRLPLGVAFRLAKVLGVSCEILFEDYA